MLDQTSDDARLQTSGLRFEWNSLKARNNLKKHRVSFEHAQTVFGDKFMVDAPDTEHSDEEARYIAVGRAINHQILFVVFTEVQDGIRIIGARVAQPWERREYEIGT